MRKLKLTILLLIVLGVSFSSTLQPVSPTENGHLSQVGVSFSFMPYPSLAGSHYSPNGLIGGIDGIMPTDWNAGYSQGANSRIGVDLGAPTRFNWIGANLGGTVKGNITFNVLDYASSLAIWDETDLGMPYATGGKHPGSLVKFFSNYSSSIFPIYGANCSIWFNDSGWARMVWNTSGFYWYNRSFASVGTYGWNVSCIKAGYNPASANDTAIILSSYVALVSPSAGESLNSSKMEFNWTTYNFSSDPTCNVSVNGIVVFSGNCTANQSCTANDTTKKGFYLWNVTCYSGNDSATSETRNFSVRLKGQKWIKITLPEGIFEPSNPGLSGTHKNNFTFKFIGLEISPDETVYCDVLRNGTTMQLFGSNLDLNGTDYSLFYPMNASDPIIKDPGVGYLPWILKRCAVVDALGDVIYQENFSHRIYVHPAAYWTDDEITRAVTCQGTPGVYFNNTGKCKFSKDTMFSLQMRNGNPVDPRCFNESGAVCGSDYCRGIFFPSCEPAEYFTGYNALSDDPNGYTTFTASFAGYATDIGYQRYVNSSGSFKLRVLQNLTDKPFSVTIYNLSEVDAARTNVYGSGAASGTTGITDQGDGTWTVAYYNFTSFSGTLDFVFNVSFTNAAIGQERVLSLVLAYGTSTNQGSPPYYNATFDPEIGVRSDNESERTSIMNDLGGTCGDGVNNDFNYVNGAFALDLDCLDPFCNNQPGGYNQTNEFALGITGPCNYLNERNCTDRFDNDYNDYTDCHDADCFRTDPACPVVEAICNDSVNNDWDYVSSANILGENGHNNEKYEPLQGRNINLTDCKDLGCNASQGGLTGQLCNWGHELNCSDGFNNDALQLADCELNTMASSTQMPGIGDAEYDCSSYCRQNITATETGALCDNGKDDDLDAILVSGYYSGVVNLAYGAGTDCRWLDYNPDEDCNGSVMGSGKRCELGRELTCNDSFDNDYDANAPAAMRPSPGWNASTYPATFGLSFVANADYNDYDCQHGPAVPASESQNASWCFDGMDNDMDKYFWNGNSLALNSTGGTDCADPDCMGIINPNNGSQACLAREYDPSDAFFLNLPFPGMYCANGIDDDVDNSLGWPLGGIDCRDPDCNKQFGMCDGPCYSTENISWNSCMNGADDDYDMPASLTDCRDSDCAGMLASASGAICGIGNETDCSDGFDNNADGKTDCAEPACAGKTGGRVNNTLVYCQASETSCFDGFDNDRNGFIDCYDSSCTASCGLATIIGTPPISLPVYASASLNQVTDASVLSHTRQVRKGEWYNITLRMTGASTNAQWTLGTAAGKFNKSAFNLSTAELSGPDAGRFDLSETDNGFVLNSNHVSLPSGYTVAFSISSTTVLAQASFELTYAEEQGSKTSLNNLMAQEVDEDAPPVAQLIRAVPASGRVPVGGTVYLRANASDNNRLGLCMWKVYGAGVFNPLDSTACRATFSPTVEGLYYINATPKDYYSNSGAPLAINYSINIIPVPASISLDKPAPFYNGAVETARVNATFSLASSDSLSSCEAFAKNASGETSLGTFAPTGASCYRSALGLSPLADGEYRLFMRATESTEGDIVDSNSAALFVCSGSGGVCAFADFNSNNKPDACEAPGAISSVLVYPENSFTLRNSSVDFACRAAAGSLSNITLSIWAPAVLNYSSTIPISGNLSLSNWTVSLGDGSYSWNCLAYSAEGNSAWAPANWTLLINTTEPPPCLEGLLTLNGIDGDINISKGDRVALSANFSDSIRGNIFIYRDGKIKTTLTNGTGVTYSSNDYWIDKWYNITAVFIPESGCNTSSATHFIIVGPDTTPPALTMNNPVWMGASAYFRFNATDNNKGYMKNCTLYINGAPWETKYNILLETTFDFSALGLSEGIGQNATLNCYDQGDNLGVGAWIFNIDRTAPQIGILSPANGSLVYIPKPEFLLNVSDNLAMLFSYVVYVDGIAHSQGSGVAAGNSSIITIDQISSGLHIFIVEITDLAGNKRNSTPMYLNISDSLVYLLDPPDGNRTYSQNLSFSFIFQDSKYDGAICSLYINHPYFDICSVVYYANGTCVRNPYPRNNTCAVSCVQGPAMTDYFFTRTPGAFGLPLNPSSFSGGFEMGWRVVCDTPEYSRADSSFITIDYTPPAAILSITPPSGSVYLANMAQFNIAIFDNNSLGYAVLESNLSGQMENVALSCSGSSINQTCATFYDLPAGRYFVSYHVINYVGLETTVSTVYALEKRAPIIAMSASPGWHVVRQDNAAVTCSVANNQTEISLYRDGGFVGSSMGGQVLDYMPQVIGNYAYVCNSSESQNYTAGSISNSGTVIPLLTLSVNPAWSMIYPTPSTVRCVAGYPNSTALLYLNGSPVGNPHSASFPAGAYNYSCIIPQSGHYPAEETSALLTMAQGRDSVSLTLNGNPGSMSAPYGTNVTAAANSTSGTHSLYRDDIPISNPNTSSGLGIGNYTYLANSTGTANYTPNNVSRNLEIFKATPALLLNSSPASPIAIDYPTQANASATVICAIPNTFTSIALNYGPVQVNESIFGGSISYFGVYGLGSYAFNCTASETQNYTQYARFLTLSVVPAHSYCGDGACNRPSENYSVCPVDCPAACGNGWCDSPLETPASCNSDCPSVCGDGLCSSGEDAANCNGLSGGDCNSTCGDNLCTEEEDFIVCGADCEGSLCGAYGCERPYEDATNCPTDCGATCGDNVCEGDEACSTCLGDCGACGGATCGDGACNGAENPSRCRIDCPSVCGDGLCTYGENYRNCSDCAVPPICGNNVCERPYENAGNCRGDCPPVCGDGVCNNGENALYCPLDCASRCGDGWCTYGENYITCSRDCGTGGGGGGLDPWWSVCGNGGCERPYENTYNCPTDCHISCGDHICESGESCSSCSHDCGSCGGWGGGGGGGGTLPYCGDGLCRGGESASNCNSDCPSVCGDRWCTGGESHSSCSSDCPGGPAPPTCGNGRCQSGESACNCARDCARACGDGCCSGSEGYYNCWSDCSSQAPLAGISMTASPSWTVYVGQTSTVRCNSSTSSVSLRFNGNPVSTYDSRVLPLGSYSYSCTASAVSGRYREHTVSNTLSVIKWPTIMNLNSSLGWIVWAGEDTTISCGINHGETTPALYGPGENEIPNPFTVAYFIKGRFNYSCNSSETATHDSAESKKTLLVYNARCYLSFDPPQVNLTKPQINYTESFTATCECTNPEASPTLARNGENVTNESGISVMLGAGTHSYVCSVAETENYLAPPNESSYMVGKAPGAISIILNGSSTNMTINQSHDVLIGSSMVNPPLSGDITIREQLSSPYCTPGYQPQKTMADCALIQSNWPSPDTCLIWKDNPPVSSIDLLSCGPGRAIWSGTDITEVVRTYETPGNYTVTAIYPGNANYTSASSSLVVAVDRYVPPSIYLSPSRGQWISDPNPYFSFRMFNNYSNSATCDAFVNGILVDSGVVVAAEEAHSTQVSGLLSEGWNQSWNVDCIDSIGLAIFGNATFNVDFTPPIAEILSGDAVTEDPTPTILVNLSDNLSPLLRYVVYVDGVPNIQGSGIRSGIPTNITLNQISHGPHLVHVMATDLANFSANSSPVNITLNGTVVFLISPAKDAWIASRDVAFSFRYISPRYPSMACDFYLGGGLNQTNASTSNGTATWFVVYNLSSQRALSWNVTCRDPADPLISVGDSSYFSIESEYPKWSNASVYPESPATLLQMKAANYTVQFNVTFEDELGLGEVSIEHNFSGSPSAYGMSCVCTNRTVNLIIEGQDVPTEICFKKECTYSIRPDLGNYTYRFTGSNLAGLANSTPAYNYEIVLSLANYIFLLDGMDSDIFVVKGSTVNMTLRFIDPYYGTIYAYEKPSWSTRGPELLGRCISTYGCSFYTDYMIPGRYTETTQLYNTKDYSMSDKTHIIYVVSGNVTFLPPTDEHESRVNRDYILANVSTLLSSIDYMIVQLFDSNRNLLAYNITNSTSFFTNFTGLAPGTYYINASVYDLVGGMDSTETRIITVVPEAMYWTGIIPPEGVFEPYGPSLSGTHFSTFSIRFLGLNASSDKNISCIIQNPGGTAFEASASGLDVSNQDYDLNYTVLGSDLIINDPNAGYLPWVLKSCSMSVDGEVLFTEPVNSRIYVHNPVYWADDEITRAVTCQGTPGVYFNNTGKCEFSKDTMLALQMRNGNPVQESCFNNPGVGCEYDYCRGLFFPTCEPAEYFSGYSALSDDPNGYTTFTASVGSYATPIAYTRHVNSNGSFKLRATETLAGKPFSFTVYNLKNVDAAKTNVYGSGLGSGNLAVTDQGDGTWAVAYYNFGSFSGTLDFTFNISFAGPAIDENISAFLVVAYGTSTNQGNPPYFDVSFSPINGLGNSNEAEVSPITLDFGGPCSDRANNDFDYLGLGGTWNFSYDCYDSDCDSQYGDYSQANEFGTGKTGLCNYLNERNCTDQFDNNYDGYTDCHDVSCFHSDPACPMVETICNDSLNNDWDYTVASDPIGNNGTKYAKPDFIYDITDCQDSDCNGLQGGLAGQACSWGYELNCSDGFNNDALQLKDCDLNTMAGPTQMPVIGDAEYDCSLYCRQSITATETGALCDNGKDDDYDAMMVTGHYAGIVNLSYGAGTDCRWLDYNPDEDCNGSIMGSGKRCELGRELTCNDSFDNDYDADAPAAMRPSPGWNASTYLATFGLPFVSNADYSDYDCQYDAAVPASESLNASWCFDGIDNDMDKYFWNVSAWSLNSTGGIDCADPDCMGVTNPANENQTCLTNEYNSTDPFFINLPYPGLYCANGLDDDVDNALGWPLGGIDCRDPDCNKQFGMCEGPCYSTENVSWNSCMNGIDDDYEMPASLTDCRDSDCAGLPGSATGAICGIGNETDCADNFDNNADGKTDCADPACIGKAGGRANNTPVYCQAGETSCFDGFDNDRNGFSDCYDASCNAACGLSNISGTAPISLPVVSSTIPLSQVSNAYIQSATRQARQGELYNITMRMTEASTNAQWTIGTAARKFNKSAFNTSSAALSGPNAASFTILATANGYVLNSNRESLPSGYTFSFIIQSSSAMPPSTYELTYAEEDGAKTSLNNYIPYEVDENTPPSAQYIRAVPASGRVPVGGTVYLRANASDNNRLGLCMWKAYGAGVFSPLNSTVCRATFNPTVEGLYYINATPKDYYSNLGAPLTLPYNINMIPAPVSISLNKSAPFYNASRETARVNATFSLASSDSISSCEAFARNASWETSLGAFAPFGASCSVALNLSALADGEYILFVRATESTEGDIVESNSTALFVCRGSGGVCAFADFNSDGKPDTCKLPAVMSTVLISPENDSISITNNVNFSCRATSGSLSNITLFVWNSTGLKYNSTKAISGESNSSNWTVSLASGNYSWNCLAYSTEGNRSWAPANWTLVVNNNPPVPNISIISPANNAAFGSLEIPINFTVQSPAYPLDSCWYTIDGSAQYPLPGCANITTPTLSQGTHNLTIYANNSLGAVGSSSSRFTISIKKLEVYAVSPDDNSITNSTDMLFQWRAAGDFDSADCSLIIDGAVSDSQPALNGTLVNSTQTLGYGAHSWQVRCNSSDAQGSSAYRSLMVYNSSAPASTINVTLNSPPSGAKINASQLPLALNYTVNDDIYPSASCTLFINARPFAVQNSSVGVESIINFTGPQGIYLWRVECSDASGSSNSSEERSFIIINITTSDSIPPVVRLVSPANNYYAYTHVISGIFSATDDTDTTLLCTLAVYDSSLRFASQVYALNGTQSEAIFSTLDNGTYYWNVSCLDRGGNVGVSPTWLFNIIDAHCGDGVCNANENCNNCRQDCSCPPPHEPPCTDECSLPDTGCSDPLVRWYCTQADSDSCLDQMFVSCQIGDVCVFGTCVNICTDECSTGESGCDSESQGWYCGSSAQDGCLHKLPLQCGLFESCQNGICSSLCISDDVCNPACTGTDPDCCALDSDCIGGRVCLNSTCTLPQCAADEVCNTACANDPDCCVKDGVCPSIGCVKPFDPDCGKPPGGGEPGGGQTNGTEPSGKGCSYSNPMCGECFSCQSNTCVALTQSYEISAPLEAELGSEVSVSLADSTGRQVSSSFIEITDPLNRTSKYITNSAGTARFLASLEGYYTYSLPPTCSGIRLSSTSVTYVYNASAPASTKRLVIPLYVSEPSQVRVEVISLGNPQQASISVTSPNSQIKNAETSQGGTYTDALMTPGKYVFVITASNVKSLSAKIGLSVLPGIGNIYFTEPQVVALLLLILIAIGVAYVARNRILALVSGKRYATAKISPARPKAGETVTITLISGSGAPVRGVVLLIVNEKGEKSSLRTDEKGRVVFIPSRAGRYFILSSQITIGNSKIVVL